MKGTTIENFVGYTKKVFLISTITLTEILLIVQIVEWVVLINIDWSFVSAYFFTDFNGT